MFYYRALFIYYFAVVYFYTLFGAAMKKPFMTYYENIAKLATIANKQTMFLAHILSMAEFDGEVKNLVVELTPRTKRRILADIGCVSKDPLNLARTYIKQLVKAGLIKQLERNVYVIDPESYSYSSYITKDLRNRSARIFEKISYEPSSNVTNKEVWVELNSGEVRQVRDGEILDRDG